MGCHFLLQGIFPTQGLNPHVLRLLHWQVGSLPLRHLRRLGFPGGSMVKNPPAKQETWVRSLGREDPLEKEIATHSNILAWIIPWTEKTGGYSLRGCKRVQHD